MAMAVGRSALLFLVLYVLLYCSLAMAIPSSKDMLEEETEESMVALQQNHKHSGFSQAECPGACQFRCSKTAYRKPCMFFCQKCCFKCRCVPPGTYAHKEVCPCYNNWKTKRGGPKCP